MLSIQEGFVVDLWLQLNCTGQAAPGMQLEVWVQSLLEI